MLLSEFDYLLPEELIAREPPAERDGARMMHVPRAGNFAPTTFRELPRYLRKGDLLVLNDAKVIKARLRGRKVDSGGEVEVLLDRPASKSTWYALGNASKPFREGQWLELGGAKVRVVGPAENGRLTLDFGEVDALALAADKGELPLPPYLERAPTAADDERYQTVYAKMAGAVAAPTAGLHFTPGMLATLRAQGVRVETLTLLVGPGTFLPVRTEQVDEHKMMEERYAISDSLARAFAETREEKGRVVAVGTTVARALESAVTEQRSLRSGEATTDLFIKPGRPGHTFRAIDGLLTNFHLPKSTLLMLVSAFAGVERVREVYAAAIVARFRFFSYGDCCLFL